MKPGRNAKTVIVKLNGSMTTLTGKRITHDRIARNARFLHEKKRSR